MFKKLLLSILPLSFIFTAYGEVENLYLNGIVKEIDNQFVIVDVKSLSCNGVRKFKLGEKVDLRKFKVGKEIYFFIDSSYCKSEEINTIVEVD